MKRFQLNLILKFLKKNKSDISKHKKEVPYLAKTEVSESEIKRM